MSKGFRQAILWLFVVVEIVIVFIVTNMVIKLGGRVNHEFYFQFMLPGMLVAIAFQVIPLLSYFKSPKS